MNAVNRVSFDDTIQEARIRRPRSLAVQCFHFKSLPFALRPAALRRGLVASKAHNYLDIIKH